jgi:hypothetical protein
MTPQEDPGRGILEDEAVRSVEELLPGFDCVEGNLARAFAPTAAGDSAVLALSETSVDAPAPSATATATAAGAVEEPAVLEPARDSAGEGMRDALPGVPAALHTPPGAQDAALPPLGPSYSQWSETLAGQLVPVYSVSTPPDWPSSPNVTREDSTLLSPGLQRHFSSMM